MSDITNKNEFNAIKWRCRRGMREMDALLDVFLENHYASLNSDQLNAFKEMLEMQDPELFSLLMHKSSTDNFLYQQIILLINPVAK